MSNGNTVPDGRRNVEGARPDNDPVIELHLIGDFYEAFGADATALAECCGLTATKTSDGKTLCGFPKFRADAYLERIAVTGYSAYLRYNGVSIPVEDGYGK